MELMHGAGTGRSVREVFESSVSDGRPLGSKSLGVDPEAADPKPSLANSACATPSRLAGAVRDRQSSHADQRHSFRRWKIPTILTLRRGEGWLPSTNFTHPVRVERSRDTVQY
jgi:hypothetical protein